MKTNEIWDKMVHNNIKKRKCVNEIQKRLYFRESCEKVKFECILRI